MKRSYKQNCALAHALDVVGERWTLLVVRELLLRPRRYGELLDNLVGIGTNLLADRLKEMETNGLVEKDDQRYRLTATGRQLEPVVWDLVRFGLGLDVSNNPQHLSRSEWDAVALRALYRPLQDRGLAGRYVLELNGKPLCIEKIGSELRITPEDCQDPQVRITLSTASARKLAEGKLTLTDGIRQGKIRVLGRRQDAKELLIAFGMGG